MSPGVLEREETLWRQVHAHVEVCGLFLVARTIDDRHGASESYHMNFVKGAGASGVELATVSIGSRVSSVLANCGSQLDGSFFLHVKLLEPTDPQIHVIAVAGRVLFLSGLSKHAEDTYPEKKQKQKRRPHAAKVDGDADDELGRLDFDNASKTGTRAPQSRS